MKILLTTLGSRGDVQPYLALAIGLKARRHVPVLAIPDTFTKWVRSYGIEVIPLPFNPQEVMQKLGQEQNSFRAMRDVLGVVREGLRTVQATVWEAARDTDFFIQSATGMGVMEATELLKIPGAFAHLIPFAPTRAWPMFWLPVRGSLGGTYNLLTHKIMAVVLWRFGGAMVNEWRGELGLANLRSDAEIMRLASERNIPFIYGYSPSVIPPPLDWNERQHVTGYWFLDTSSDWEPPAPLLDFLASGLPPVYIGFGSMNIKHPERYTRLALDALRLSGQRGILLTGWGGIAKTATTEDVLVVQDVPHSWLFPRIAAIVHHGGAGTTAAGFRAGIPQIVTPFGGDQFSWANIVCKAEVGSEVEIAKRLTAEQLAEVINATINDKIMRARAAALGDKIRAEDGIARAVEIIEKTYEQTNI